MLRARSRLVGALSSRYATPQVKLPSVGVFGFKLAEASEDGKVVVGAVEPGSPAALAGVLQGDAVVAIGNTEMIGLRLPAAQQALLGELRSHGQAYVEEEEAMGGTYRCTRSVQVRSQPARDKGIPTGNLREGEKIKSTSMALDNDHTWWLRCELGWAALDSRDGQHMLVRTDQKLNRSSCIEWKFGPAVTLEVHRIDDDKVRELFAMEAQLTALLAEECSDEERWSMEETLQHVRASLRSELAAGGEYASPTEVEMRRDFVLVDADGDGVLNHDEIEVLLNSRGYQEITQDYVQEIIRMFAGDDRALDYTEFRALCDWLEKTDAETAGDEEVGSGRGGDDSPEQDWNQHVGQEEDEEEVLGAESTVDELSADEMENFGAYCAENGVLMYGNVFSSS